MSKKYTWSTGDLILSDDGKYTCAAIAYAVRTQETRTMAVAMVPKAVLNMEQATEAWCTVDDAIYFCTQAYLGIEHRKRIEELSRDDVEWPVKMQLRNPQTRSWDSYEIAVEFTPSLSYKLAPEVHT